MNWYAVLTRPRHEKKIARRLLALGVDVFVPLRKSINQWADRKKLVVTPIFPGYIFVRTDAAGLREIAYDSGVVNPLASYSRAQQLRDDAIASMRLLARRMEEERGAGADLVDAIRQGRYPALNLDRSNPESSRVTVAETMLSFEL